MNTTPLTSTIERFAHLTDTTPSDLVDQITGIAPAASTLAAAMHAGWGSADLPTAVTE